MGYGDGVKGYRIWSPTVGRIIMSRNVVFDENSMFNPTVKSIVVADSDSVDKQVESKSLMMRVMIINTLFLKHHHLQYQMMRRLTWLESVL